MRCLLLCLLALFLSSCGLVSQQSGSLDPVELPVAGPSALVDLNFDGLLDLKDEEVDALLEHRLFVISGTFIPRNLLYNGVLSVPPGSIGLNRMLVGPATLKPGWRLHTRFFLESIQTDSCSLGVGLGGQSGPVFMLLPTGRPIMNLVYEDFKLPQLLGPIPVERASWLDMIIEAVPTTEKSPEGAALVTLRGKLFRKNDGEPRQYTFSFNTLADRVAGCPSILAGITGQCPVHIDFIQLSPLSDNSP